MTPELTFLTNWLLVIKSSGQLAQEYSMRRLAFQGDYALTGLGAPRNEARGHAIASSGDLEESSTASFCKSRFAPCRSRDRGVGGAADVISPGVQRAYCCLQEV